MRGLSEELSTPMAGGDGERSSVARGQLHPPPRSRPGHRATRPARRVVVVLDGGAPRRPVKSSRRQPPACAGGRRGGSARCGGKHSRRRRRIASAATRTRGWVRGWGSAPRRGPRVPDDRRCRTSQRTSTRRRGSYPGASHFAHGGARGSAIAYATAGVRPSDPSAALSSIKPPSELTRA